MGPAQQDPCMGTLPKLPPARREAEKAQKKAGGTMLDEMPRHGPCLDDRYGGPNKTGKKDGWSVTKCGQDVYLVRIHPPQGSRNSTSCTEVHLLMPSSSRVNVSPKRFTFNLSIQLEPATVPDGPPWLAPQPTRDDDLDVHVGRPYELHTPSDWKAVLGWVPRKQRHWNLVQR